MHRDRHTSFAPRARREISCDLARALANVAPPSISARPVLTTSSSDVPALRVIAHARVFPRVHKEIFSCEKNVFDGFLKSLFVISALHAEECAVAAPAPM